MAFGQDPDQAPQYQFYKRIYTEIFQTLGYEFSYQLCPSKRCSLMANSGDVDGEPQRIKSYNQRYPNLIRVEEPVFINRTRIFTFNPEIAEQKNLSLEGTGYRIEYLRGSVWSQQYLTSRVQPHLLSEVATSRQALKRLMLGRTDIFIALEAPVMKLLQEPEFASAGIVSVGVVGKNESFPYLYKSHAALVPEVTRALRAMKQDGRYDTLLIQAMPFLIPGEPNLKGE